MRSLLQTSDSNITTYHRSLRDFFQDKKRAVQYHIHPLRVGLVRQPERSRPFGEGVVIGLITLVIFVCSEVYDGIFCGMCPGRR